MSPSLLGHKVRMVFASSEATEVIEILEALDFGLSSDEMNRVRLGIVKLCSEEGRERLEVFCAGAKRDYRDILFWAESPNEAKLTVAQRTEPLRVRAARKRDRQEYQAWLES